MIPLIKCKPVEEAGLKLKYTCMRENEMVPEKRSVYM